MNDVKKQIEDSLEDFQLEQTKLEAKTELTEIEAVRVLVKNNDLACTVNIAGMSIGLCVNESILPALQRQEEEIHKLLSGKESNY